MPRSRYTFDAENFVVVTPFDWNERHFDEGEAFPWRELGLVEYQRRLLWIANKIDVAPPAPAVQAEPPPAAPPAPVVPQAAAKPSRAERRAARS